MIFFNQEGVKCQTEMEFESPSLAGLGHHILPGLGPHNDRGFGVFACPHPRFRELDFCRPNSGSSTITIKDVDRYMEDLTRPSKHLKKSKEKKVVETIEETASKEVTGIDTNAKEDDQEKVKAYILKVRVLRVRTLPIFLDFPPNFEAENEEPIKFALCLKTTLPIFSQSCSIIA